MRPTHFALFVLPALCLGAGCAATGRARYVYQDGQFGVVGIPENTDRWPTHYRRQAEALMAAHFPEGHQIVRAEEVVEGSRTLTLEGTHTAELSPQLPTELLKIAKLGRTAARRQSDSLKIKECRIIYRRTPAPSAPYADQPTLTPTRYVDPNAGAPAPAAEGEDAPGEKAEAACP